MRHDTAPVGRHAQCLLFMSECK